MSEDRLPPRRAAMPPGKQWFAGIGGERNRRGYLRDVREFMDHAGLREPEELRDAAPEQVENWREALLARPLRPATVRRKLSALSSLFDDLLAKGAVEANPVRGVKRPVDEEGRHAAPVLTGEQARRLLDAPPEGTLKGLRDRTILAVLLCQGLTREELCGLRVGDLVDRAARPCLKVGGNRGRMRTMLLHPEAKRRIEAYLHEAGHGRDPSAPLFRPVANNRGGGTLDRALDPGSVYSKVVRYHADRTGLTREVEGLCAHSLRATAAATRPRCMTARGPRRSGTSSGTPISPQPCATTAPRRATASPRHCISPIPGPNRRAEGRRPGAGAAGQASPKLGTPLHEPGQRSIHRGDPMNPATDYRNRQIERLRADVEVLRGKPRRLACAGPPSGGRCPNCPDCLHHSN